MERFEELLSDYREGVLDAAGRAELALWIARDSACLDAFVEVVSDQRIRRLELQRG